MGGQLLRRLFAGLGLVALLPVAWSLVGGRMSLLDGGIRGFVILAVVVILSRLTPWLVLRFADTLDGAWEGKEREAAE